MLRRALEAAARPLPDWLNGNTPCTSGPNRPTVDRGLSRSSRVGSGGGRYRSLAIRTSIRLVVPAGEHQVSSGIAEGGRRRERADGTAGPAAGGGGLRRARRPADRAGRAVAGAGRDRGRALAGGAAPGTGARRPAPPGGRDRRGAAAGARPPGRGRGAGEGRGRAEAADAGEAGR